MHNDFEPKVITIGTFRQRDLIWEAVVDGNYGDLIWACEFCAFELQDATEHYEVLSIKHTMDKVIHSMTNDTKQQRVVSAIESGDEEELLWAYDYCENRLRLCGSVIAVKHWKDMMEQLDKKMDVD